MKRSFLTVLAGCGALVVSAAPPAAAALGSSASLGVPTVSVPTVSVPTVTVPSLTVPSVSVGTVTTPQVSVPPVTTPPVSAPSLPTPTVTTPTLTHVSQTPIDRAGSTSTPTGSAASPGTVATGRSGSASHASPSPGQSRSTPPAVAHASARGATRARHTGASFGTPGLASAALAARRSPPRLRPRAPTATASAKPSGTISRLVKVLPTAVLFALLAFAVVAAVMALNAYIQSRRARSLAGQRAALLSDVGVLQAALLPAVPASIGELGVSVAYRPAQGLAAGGDFFDVFTLSPERTGIIIGDVSGHGRESLIHAALVRYTLRTLMGEGHRLPDVLARADRYLTGELGDGFVTVIICAYEHATGELTWAKAGHEPPIISGQPDAPEQSATPLGLGLGDTWPQFSRRLAGGERVCLFTDGLTEARRHGEQLGRAHLASLVEQGLSAQGIVDRIQSDADVCNDDLAAVVITRNAAVPAVAASGAREAAAV